MIDNKTLSNECRQVREYFWNFYAQNHLWFRIGDGTESYGYSPLTIVNEGLRNRVNSAFESTTNKFFDMTCKALEQSIRSEAKYAFGPRVKSLIDDAIRWDDDWIDEICKKYGHDNDAIDIDKLVVKELKRHLQSIDKRINLKKSPKTVPIKWVKYAFGWEGWSDSYCGSKWANACEVLLESETVKNKPLKDRIFWIDRALDLYHNNGFLMNKTPFAALEACADLDKRAELRDWVKVANDTELLKKRINVEDSNRASCLLEQPRYPLSSFTKNLILANASKL